MQFMLPFPEDAEDPPPPVNLFQLKEFKKLVCFFTLFWFEGGAPPPLYVAVERFEAFDTELAKDDVGRDECDKILLEFSLLWIITFSFMYSDTPP